MTPDQSAVLAMLSQVAQSLGAADKSRDDTLTMITEATKNTIPGADAVSISVKAADKRFETLAPTDQLALDADRLQYELGEGPCVDAVSGEPVIRSGRVQDDHRWPAYGPRASADFAVGSQVAFRMFSDARIHGGLNIYSLSAGQFDEADIALAELFAHNAAVAMGHAAKVKQLDEALATRKIIGEALGLIMERYDVDESRAFQFLARMSQTSNIKLRVVAEEIVTSANDKAGHTAGPAI